MGLKWRFDANTRTDTGCSSRGGSTRKAHEYSSRSNSGGGRGDQRQIIILSRSRRLHVVAGERTSKGLVAYEP